MNKRQITEPKQVIVMRSDLKNTKGEKLRKGKLIAQGAHASMAVLLKKARDNKEFDEWVKRTESYDLVIPLEKDTAMFDWLESHFTKIVLKCDSEQELTALYENALSKGLDTVMITDSGFTEFGGIPTKTCIAIGPDYPDKINEITGHLKLFN